MIPVITKAHELDCSFVLFDQDGEVHECFKTWEW